LLIDKVKRDLNIDMALSNELLADHGILTGDIRINVEHDSKGLWVKRILSMLRLGRSQAAAVGDGEGDGGMFESVGLAIGYHPSDSVLPLLDHVLHNGSFMEILNPIRAHR
jgi:phosphoserine phosphatase